jgi:hypothetical protein
MADKRPYVSTPDIFVALRQHGMSVKEIMHIWRAVGEKLNADEERLKGFDNGLQPYNRDLRPIYEEAVELGRDLVERLL